MKLKDEALILLNIESGLYKSYKSGNKEMYQFLMDLEQEKLEELNPDRAFKILNHLAVKNKLGRENSSSVVMLLNGIEQNIPLKRLANNLEKIFVTDNETFSNNYNDFASDQLKSFFLCNDYLVADGYDISINRLLDLDITEVLISRLMKYKDAKSKDIIADLFFIYPDLDLDKYKLENIKNVFPLANRFSLAANSLDNTLRRDLLFTLAYMHIFDEAEIISYETFNDNFKYMNDFFASTLSLLDNDQVDTVINSTISNLAAENLFTKNETNSFNYVKKALRSHLSNTNKLQKTLYKG